MAERKVFRKIDRRNNLYNQYKYQVVLGRMKTPAGEITSWCYRTWGSQREFNSYRTYNVHWRTTKKGSRTPILYLRDDAEATLFGLHWSGK